MHPPRKTESSSCGRNVVWLCSRRRAAAISTLTYPPLHDLRHMKSRLSMAGVELSPPPHHVRSATIDEQFTTYCG